jgi:predicted dehydrogenase
MAISYDVWFENGLNNMNYNIGVIGLGKIASHFHIPAWTEISNCTLHALCDSNQSTLELKGKEYSITNLYADYQELLKDKSTDIININTPNKFHYQQTIDSLNTGKHVVIEKPFALNSGEAKEMVACAKANKVKLMCTHQSRFRPETKTIVDAINRNELGEIYYVKATNIANRGVPEPSHYILNSKNGGGPINDIGVHMLDLAWLFLGCPEPVSVYAIKHNTFSQTNEYVLNRSGDNIKETYDCEDLGIIQIKFKKNKSLCLETSYLLNHPENIVECKVYGTKGGITWPDNKIVKSNKGAIEISYLEKEKPYYASIKQLEHFVNCIEQNRKTIIPPEQSVTIIQMLEAIHLSAFGNNIIYL